MEELKKIISIVSRNKVKKVEIIGQSISKTKLFKLYELIEKGDVDTDQEAMEIIYPEDPEKSRNSYFKLKYFLRRRLLNTMFFINTRTIQQEQVQFRVDAVRKMMEIRLLVSNGASDVAIKLAKKLLQKVEQNEFWDLAASLARFIRRQYIIKVPHYRNFQKYDEKLKQVLEVEGVVILAEGLYYQLVAQMIHNKSTNLELFAQAKEAEEILSRQSLELPSVSFNFFKNAVSTIKYMCAYEYDKASTVLNRALLELKKPKFYSNYYSGYLINLIACNTYLKQYEEGNLNIEKALLYTTPGSFNWAQLMSRQVVLAFHSRMFDPIYPIYLKTISHKGFKGIPFAFREVWVLYFAWLYLLSRVGMVELPPKTFPKNFNLDKLLDKLKETAKDKNGLSINIRIIRTVGWLLDEDYDALIDRDDSLKRYRYRYVRNSAQRRSNLILRYLINIQKRDFVNIKCKNITQSAKKSFSELAIELKWADFEIEILPLDDVVGIISDIMDANSRRIRP